MTSDALHQSGAELPAERWARWAEAQVRTLLQCSSRSFIRSFAIQTSQIRLSIRLHLHTVWRSVRLRPLRLDTQWHHINESSPLLLTTLINRVHTDRSLSSCPSSPHLTSCSSEHAHWPSLACVGGAPKNPLLWCHCGVFPVWAFCHTILWGQLSLRTGGGEGGRVGRREGGEELRLFTNKHEAAGNSCFKVVPGIPGGPGRPLLGSHLDVFGKSVDPGIHSLLDPDLVSAVSAEDTKTLSHFLLLWCFCVRDSRQVSSSHLLCFYMTTL